PRLVRPCGPGGRAGGCRCSAGSHARHRLPPGASRRCPARTRNRSVRTPPAEATVRSGRAAFSSSASWDHGPEWPPPTIRRRDRHCSGPWHVHLPAIRDQRAAGLPPALAIIGAMNMLRVAALAACFLLAACGSTPAPLDAFQQPQSPAHRPGALLAPIDGFRADYLELGLTPNLQRLADEGVRAKWMTPSYPSLTFPNHYTLVTGLRPDRHGVVHNTMSDPLLGKFRISDREAVGNGAWWGGEPAWVGAENAGMPTAAMFWVGSEAPVAGVRPTRWSQFDAQVGVDERVDRVLGWLAEPDATRPRLATLYFEHLDSTGHRHGPHAPETHQVLQEMDAAVGRLLDGLATAGLTDRVDLLVVSDHGMAEVPAGHVVAVEDMVDPADVELVSAGQSIGFQPLPGRR